MKICYVDESGCTGMLASTNSSIQPVLVFAGLMIDYSRLHSVTEQFLTLKQKYFPNLFPSDRRYFLSGILAEIKGSQLRHNVAHGNRNLIRHTFGFFDGVFKILEDNNAQTLGRVWVKGIGSPIDGKAIYTFSIQSVATTFQEFLRATDDIGFIVLDSRRKSLNAEVAHSLFTQKFRFSGDAIDRIVELPTFAHSDNHAMLQIADVVASGLLFPLAAFSYCSGHMVNLHVRPQYRLIKSRYATRLRNLQYRYKEASGRERGGIVVSDSLTQKPGSMLFK
ncbi:MAG: DUF3800 domain-containing protein [Alphaproteobacteria bacterium]|nr:DUF3800 domain-containing protein [Alphaproteobacteria bacterium]